MFVFVCIFVVSVYCLRVCMSICVYGNVFAKVCV